MNTPALTLPAQPNESMLDLDDDTPLAPACPLRTGSEEGPCEACQ